MPTGVDYETEDLLIRHVKGITIARVRYPTLNGMVEVSRMTDELVKLVDDGVLQLMFDCKYVKFAGSAALGMLILLQKKLAKLGGKMVISHSENIADLLKVSRMASLFQLASDPKQAMAFFGK